MLGRLLSATARVAQRGLCVSIYVLYRVDYHFEIFPSPVNKSSLSYLLIHSTSGNLLTTRTLNSYFFLFELFFCNQLSKMTLSLVGKVRDKVIFLRIFLMTLIISSLSPRDLKLLMILLIYIHKHLVPFSFFHIESLVLVYQHVNLIVIHVRGSFIGDTKRFPHLVLMCSRKAS